MATKAICHDDGETQAGLSLPLVAGSPNRQVRGSRASTRERTGQATARAAAEQPAHILDSKYISQQNISNAPEEIPAGTPVVQDVSAEKGQVRLRQRQRAKWFILSGMNWYAEYLGWWITLTSAPGTRDIQISWNHLNTILSRLTRQDVVNWLTKKSRKDYSAKESRYGLSCYQGKNLTDPITFAYFKIKTSEGNGVLHMIAYGDFLPASLLRRHWKRIHGDSRQLKIKAMKRDAASMGKLNNYALGQYAYGQDQFIRGSHSYDYIFPRARAVYTALKELEGYRDALFHWRYCMMVQGFPRGIAITPEQEESIKHSTGRERVRYVPLKEALECYRATGEYTDV